MVEADDLVLDLIDLIYTAAVDLEGWPTLLERFCDIAPGAQAALLLHDNRGTRCDLEIAARCDDSFARSYTEYYASVNPWVPEVPRLGVGRPYSVGQLLPKDRLARTEFYEDWLRPQGLITGPSVVLFADDDRYMAIAALHPDEGDGGNEAERLRLLEILVPHLRRAASIHRHVAEAALAQATSQAALDSVTVGVALVASDARLRSHNQAFEAVLASNDGVRLIQGRLTAAEHRDTRALQDAVRWAASTNPDPTRHPGMVAVTRPSGRRPYTVLASPFRPRGDAPVEPLALLLVNDPEAGQGDGLSWLARLWRLTPAEERVFQALVAGQRLSEIADDLGVTRNTLKSHMKAILQKSDCQGQSDLIRVALRSTSSIHTWM